MSIPVALTLYLDSALFMLEEVEEAERVAGATGGAIYSWKTTGRSNWLEQGLSIADVLGLVVLPRGLPDVIEMADDENE